MRKVTPEQVRHFDEAKTNELCEWRKSGARRAGVPNDRSMESRWVLA